jgi:hypothetical protein
LFVVLFCLFIVAIMVVVLFLGRDWFVGLAWLGLAWLGLAWLVLALHFLLELFSQWQLPKIFFVL